MCPTRVYRVQPAGAGASDDRSPSSQDDLAGASTFSLGGRLEVAARLNGL